MSNFKIFDEHVLIISALCFIIEPIIKKLSKLERRKNINYQRKPGGGRKHKDLKKYLNTIIYVNITGAQWNSVYPDKNGRLCSGKAAHRWHMKWSRNGFYRELTRSILDFYNRIYGLKLKWCSIDGCLYKAPLGKEAVGKNPTDRGKNGTKRSIMVDEDGLPISFVHAGANVHDSKLLNETLENIFITVLNDIIEKNICLDAAYVGDKCKKIVESYNFIGHVQPRGEEKKWLKSNPLHKAKRWVVERTNSWYKQFRKLHTRYEKTKLSHDSLAYIASTMIVARTVFRSKESANPWDFIAGNIRPDEELYSIIGEELKKYLRAINIKQYAA
jgi:transposase